MKQITVCLCIAASYLSASLPITPAQTAGATAPATQTAPSPEAARIDGIIKEIRSLLSQGKFDEVDQKGEEALTLARQIGDKARQSRLYSLLGTAAVHQARKGLAIEKFRQAVLLAEEAGDNNLQSLYLHSAAVLLMASGDYDEAQSFFNHSLALRRKLNDRRGQALTLAMMSALYIDTADLITADQLLQESLQIVLELKANGKGDGQLEELVLTKIAWVKLLNGNYAAALSVVQSNIANETEHTSGANKFESRHRLGDTYLALEDYEKAASAFNDAIETARQYKVPQGSATGYFGWTQYKLGRPQEALALLSQAIDYLRQTGDFLLESDFLSYLAEVQQALRRNESALASHRQAIVAVERGRSRAVPTEASKGGWVSHHHDVFAGAIGSLLSLNRVSEALEVAEAYHARAFSDVLAESKIDLRKELSASQKLREEDLFSRIATIQKELWSPSLSKEREQQLQTELRKAEQQLEEFQLEIRRAIPRYAEVRYPQPIKPERIAKELLDADTALVEFVLGATQSYAWVIHQDKLSSTVLPPEKEIGQLIKDYRAALSEQFSPLATNRAIAGLYARSRKLHQKLFAPLEPYLTKARKLIIVADGSLLYLPFETLARGYKSSANNPMDVEYLIDRFAISYAPSATALAAIKERSGAASRNSKGIIAFGDPIYVSEKPAGADSAVAASQKPLTGPSERGFDFKQLPYTRTEVNAIASLFPADERRTFLGAEAQEETVKSEDLSGYRYVHFAVHGLIDEQVPARSGIVLSAPVDSKEDSILQMSEVMRLKLNAELVTLSACRTGLGKLLKGEGMIGLTRAFMYAGADSVLVSLWSVNDLATAELMKTFYQHLKQGEKKDEALRRAKLSLIRGRRLTWRHPYYWAPFTLIGQNN